MSAEKLARLRELRNQVNELEAEVWEEEERENYRLLNLPTEPGWYVDADEHPARLGDDGHWDDGWENGGRDYGYPVPPLRRLVEES